MNYEYKVVGAPEKPRKRRGAKTGSDRAAAAFEEMLQAEAVEGWEYVRTDVVPVTERASWFSRAREVERAVMVFRRPVEAVWRRRGPGERARKAETAPRQEPAVNPELRPVGRSEPKLSADPDRKLAEIVRGPGSRPPDH